MSSVPNFTFFYRPQGDDRFWLVFESSQYDSYSGVIVYNKMHVWIIEMTLWIGFFKELEFIVIMEEIKSYYYLTWWFWLLEQYFELKFGWVSYSGYRDHLIYELQRKLQITWKQMTMNKIPLLAIV
jgi:hypothetical protein